MPPKPRPLSHTLLLGDCLDILSQEVYRESVDMVFADLPYALTGCSWDSIIDLDRFWGMVEYVCRPKSPVVLTASQPFTSKLVMSKPKWFRCEWIWSKGTVSNPQRAKYYPLKEHESILVFCPDTPHYYPQGLQPFKGKSAQGKNSILSPVRSTKQRLCYPMARKVADYVQEFTNYPRTIQSFKTERGLHPTQKPVSLVEYMIRTYSLPGQTILDPCCGSGTTAIAARRASRNSLCVEQDQEYFAIATDRFQNELVGPIQA